MHVETLSLLLVSLLGTMHTVVCENKALLGKIGMEVKKCLEKANIPRKETMHTKALPHGLFDDPGQPGTSCDVDRYFFLK